MSDFLHVSSSPHVRSKVSTDGIMKTVLLALLPTTLFGIYNFGLHALLLILVCMATCVATEAVYEKIVNKKSTIKDCSALVTGLLLALNLPPKAPWCGSPRLFSPCAPGMGRFSRTAPSGSPSALPTRNCPI